MSSYCEVCRGLFDMPHEHCQCDAWGRQKKKHASFSTTLSTRRALSLSPAYVGRRKRGNCRITSASAPGRSGSRFDDEKRHYTCRRPLSSPSSSSSLSSSLEATVMGKAAATQRRALSTSRSMPIATGARRDTVCSLLRSNPSLAQGAALVRTPNSRKGTPSSCRRLPDGSCFVTPSSKKDLRSSGSSGMATGGAPASQRLDTLHRTLERIREAVRMDKKNALDGTKGPASGINAAAAVHIDSGEEVFSDSLNQGNSGSYDDMGATNGAEARRGFCGFVGDAAGVMSTADQRESSSQDFKNGFCAKKNYYSYSSSSSADAGCPAVEEHRNFTQDHSSALPLLSLSCSNGYFSQEGPSSAVSLTSRTDLLKNATNTASSLAETQKVELRNSTSAEGKSFISSQGCGGMSGNNVVLAHLGALREGFVELCCAVREDLRALHARVSEMEKQHKEQRQREQRYQHLQQNGSEETLCQQAAKRSEGTSAAEMKLPMSYDMLLKELQQYTLSTIHKVIQQQERQKQEERSEPICDLRSAAPQLSEPALLGCSSFQQLLSQGSLSPPGMCNLSPEAFDAHLRSAVRAILNESGFGADTLEVVARRQTRECNMKAWRREWKSRFAEFEEQQADFARTLESLRMEVEELRLRPTAPLLPRAQSAAAADMSAATVTNATMGSCQERLMRRVQKLLEGAEEQWLQAARQEIVQPVLEHVRKLMSAHQSVIDTVVESRCAQFEAYVDRSRHGWELQLVDLRSRVSSLRGDLRRALSDLSGSLNVACPGL